MKNYLIIALAAIVAILATLKACEKSPEDPQIKAIHDTIQVVKEKIVEKEKEVVKWKQAASKIRYVKEFDTLATFDTVYVELIKCDSSNAIKDIVIADQDTIINDQKVVIAKREEELKLEKKAAKRKIRRAFLAGVATGFLAGLLVPL